METTNRITDMEVDDRPRERLLSMGAKSLSNAELLAILLRVGLQGESAIQMAQRILKQVGGLAGLSRSGADRLCELKGVGSAKAAQLLAAIELGYRVARADLGARPQISSPHDAALYLRSYMTGLEQECVYVLLLDTKNRIIETVEVYQGALNSASIRACELWRIATRRNAAAIIVAHNHPSGDPTPSPEDVSVTRRLVDAGKILDIPVLDHLVIGHNRHVSLKERGLGFGAA